MSKNKILIFSGLPFLQFGNQSLYRFISMFIAEGYYVKLFFATAVEDKYLATGSYMAGLDIFRIPSVAYYIFSNLRKVFSYSSHSSTVSNNFFSKINSHHVIPPFGELNMKNAIFKWSFWILTIIDNILVYAWFRFLFPKEVQESCAIIAYEVQYTLAAKKLACVFNKPYINKFQGTSLKATNRDISLCRKYYPSLYYGINDADLSIMVNDGTDGEYYQKMRGCHNTLFIMHGVRDDYLENNDVFDDKKDHLILFNNASSSLWKRPDRIIRGLSFVNKNKLKNIFLYTTYHGPYYDDLVALSHELKVEKNVIFLGCVDNKTCFKMIKKCDCLVMTNDMSNLGNPVLEAAYFGKPILSLNDGSLDIIKIKDSVFPILIDIAPNMDAKIADAIIQIYSMKESGKLSQKIQYRNVNPLRVQQEIEFAAIRRVI